MPRALPLLIALAACSGQQTPDGPAEQYGFVTRLGADTIAVERVSRSPHTLVSDEVDRFPLVRVRHTVFSIADDGTLTKMVMDVRTPNGTTPARRGRKVTANFGSKSVKVTVEDSGATQSRTFDTDGILTVPHISMMYSVIELEIASSMLRAAKVQMHAGDSIRFHQFYPDRDVGPSFVLHQGFVHPQGNGRVELWHDWLAGIADVTVDSARRMQTYSGMRTTYKVAVTRVNDVPDIAALGAAFAATEKQRGASELSVRDTARGTIGSTNISVDYGRPLARGRQLLGNVIEYDNVWRTGANAATQFTTSAPIMIGTLAVPAGTYSLWTAPHRNSVDLIINKQNGQWGTEYDRSVNLGTVPLKADSTSTVVEKFAITVAPGDGTHGTLLFEWGTFKWSVPITTQ